MSFVAAQCPNCKANLQLDKKLEKAFCQYCGSNIYVKEAIEKVRIEISGNVKVDGIVGFEKLIDDAKTFIKLADYDTAISTYKKAIQNYPKEAEGYSGYLTAITKDFSILDIRLILADIPADLKYSDLSVSQIIKELDEYKKFEILASEDEKKEFDLRIEKWDKKCEDFIIKKEQQKELEYVNKLKEKSSISNTIICKECSGEMSNSDIECPFCGQKLPIYYKKTVGVYIFLVVMWILIYIIIFNALSE